SSQVAVLKYTKIFLASRRRHTRSRRDWSSDVCSSDLNLTESKREAIYGAVSVIWRENLHSYLTETEDAIPFNAIYSLDQRQNPRSEERRVGKERRNEWWRIPQKNREKTTEYELTCQIT